jgi:hypothetical protein
MQQYRFTFTETEFGRKDHEHYPERRATFKLRCPNFGCKPIGEPTTTPGLYYQYEWTVEADSYLDVYSLCEYCNRQGFVHTTKGPDPVFTEDEAATMRDRIAKVEETAKASGTL